MTYCFGDIISLVAQVFIVSSNKSIQRGVYGKKTYFYGSVFAIWLYLLKTSLQLFMCRPLPGCHICLTNNIDATWIIVYLNRLAFHLQHIRFYGNDIRLPHRLKHWELSIDTSGPHKGVHRWCGLSLNEHQPHICTMLTWKLIHKRYLKWLKIYSRWSEVNSCLILTITKNMIYF